MDIKDTLSKILKVTDPDIDNNPDLYMDINEDNIIYFS